jgi:site-specific recombinase XerD
MEKYSPATANKMLCALRRVLKEALRLELIDPVDYARAVDVKSIKVTKGLRGRAFTAREIAALMEVCFSDLSPTGFRDAAMLVILRASVTG